MSDLQPDTSVPATAPVSRPNLINVLCLGIAAGTAAAELLAIGLGVAALTAMAVGAPIITACTTAFQRPPHD